jgi:hypothetical protein
MVVPEETTELIPRPALNCIAHLKRAMFFLTPLNAIQMDTKNENRAMSLTVTEGLTVTVLPSADHEFLMPTKDVAIGYGVSAETIRGHLSRNPDDFYEGKHFLKGVSISNTLLSNHQPHQVFYTKRGVVRLGFFIKSDRARFFRDWAEDLIIHQLNEYADNLSGADKPPFTSPIRYDFESRVRTKVINDEIYYKVRDMSLLCGIEHTSMVMRMLPNLNNFMKITGDYWSIAEWWCNKEGVRQFLTIRKNRNMIRLHDTLFPSQLSLSMGR